MTVRRIRWAGGLLLAIGLILAGTLTVWGAPGAQESEATPPQVFDTVPLPGEELALDGPVTFFFDQPMDHAAVESAFSVTPDIAGTFTWPDDATLTFTPSAAYERATEYTFSIASSATSAAGVAMEEAFSLKLQSLGYLEISQVLPSPDSEFVDNETVFTVIFNRPVVPLMSVEDMGDLPNPITIDPPLEGVGEWLNTSIFQFTPTEELHGGSVYTVTIKAGLTDVTGSVLKDDYVWSFTTVPPEVVSLNPSDGREAMVLETPIWVNFSQAMDPAATESAFSLAPEDTLYPVAGSFKWSEDFRELTFQPDEMLEMGTSYLISVDADKALSATGAALGESAFAVFTTVPYPAIVGTSPANGEVDASPYGGFTIYFAGPMDLDSLEDKVIIDPEPWREFDTYFYDYSYSYTLSFDTEPSTDYTITILPGMEDRYGNVITEGLTVTYTTAPYPPEVTLQTPGSIGLYSAYNPATRVFVTHRNVTMLDLRLWHMSARTLADLTGPYSWEAWDNFTPRTSDLLREWTIDVSSQSDQRRYELLYISDEGASGIANIECLGAPDPQVKVGDVAVVTRDDPRPLNVRQSPDLAGQEISEVNPGDTFQIVGGPFCEGGYLWWKIALPNGIEGWAAEGDMENYYYAPLDSAPADPNAPQASNAYTPEALDPGIYYLEVSSPETNVWDDQPRSQVLLVADANITFKFSQDTALAWVTDMDSGKPLAGVPVIFYNASFNPVAQATSDENGLAQAQIPHLIDLYSTMYATIDDGTHFAFAVSGWSDGLDPWQFDMTSEYEPEDFSVYLYTDRPIYRPDQPVYFKGILRDVDDTTYSVPELTEIPVTIYDDRGETIYHETLPVTPQGSFSGELQLDPEAPLGFYRIVAEVASNTRENFGLSFSVAEYRAPEFQVTVTPEADEVVQGDTIKILVESRYFFGGSVSNAKVYYFAMASDYYFNYTGDLPGYWSFREQNYDFYSPEYYGQGGESVTEGNAETDELGRFMIEIPADLGEAGSSQTYTIEAQVTDESDQLVAGRIEVVVHQGKVYVGLQPDKYIGQANQENGVKVLAVDWDSQPVAGQTVDYNVVERRWFSVQEEDEMGRTIWTWDVEEVPVDGAEGTVTTDENGLGHITFTPPNGGTFKVYATTTDENGNEVRTSTFLWVSGSDFINWRQENSNRIQLISDKDQYAVGDTAEILIPSPFQGTAYALITVERGDILTTEVIRMDTNSTVYKLPITLDYAPNIFVSVVLSKGVDENNPTTAFRMGMVQLNVDTDQLVLNLDVSSSVDVAAGEFAGPGDTVDYTVKVTDYNGNPVEGAEVGVGLTDLAVLTIAAANSRELLPFFYSERGVSVRTSTPLTISVDQATQVIIDTIKGGGGGYGEGGIFEVRQEFVDTPLWVPSLVTDANGEVTFSATLPDNLTTWRLDARAVTMGGEGSPMLVGQTTFDLLSTKPVLIRPGTPRFFNVGDKSTLAAIINNNTNEDLIAEVTLEGTGFTLRDGIMNTQMVNIPATGRARINWPIEVLDVPFVDATFYVNAGDGAYTDASKPPVGQGADRTLPVYKYEVPETVGTAGTLYDGGSRTEVIMLPRRYNVTQGELTVRVDRSLAAATVDGLEYLRNYPYYCIEQVVSAFLPNAVTVRALTDLGVDDPVLKQHLDEEVSYALQRLYAEQKADGGWGWFVNDESNVIVTAYALIGLSEAVKAGYIVDEGVIQRATGFIEQSLVTIHPQDETWRINRQAFLLYALARSDKGNLSRVVRLFEEKESMSLYAKAYLAMTFNLLDPNDSRAMELINDLNAAMVVSATGGHWEETYQDWWNWNTDTRTTALGLMAMVQINPDNQMIPNIVRWLMVARKADSWETTQETAWAVMALTEWMVYSGELKPDYTFSVSLNGEDQALDNNSATAENVKETEVLRIEVAQLLADQANKLVFSRTDGEGNMYYTAHLRAFLPVPEVEALDRGLIVSRKYSLLNDPKRAAVTSAEVGQSLQVTVTIIAPNNLHYVVIEDPIPAGADAVNPNLLTSSSVGTQPGLDRTDPLSHGWGWWWFSNIEMRDEKVVMYATYLPRGTYEFTYVIIPSLAGEYNVIPTTGYEFYFPEVYGRSDGMLFTITGGTPSDAMAPATEEVTEEGGESAALSETFESEGGVVFQHPAGWVVMEDTEQGMVQAANSEEAAAGSTLASGQAGVVIFQPAVAEAFGAETPEDMLNSYIQVIGSESENTTFGEVEAVTIGDKAGVRATVNEGDTEGAAYAITLDDGQIVMIFGVAYTGEFAAIEPLILEIIGTIGIGG